MERGYAHKYRYGVRKIIRKLSMRQLKVAIAVLCLGSCFITLFLYYWYHSSPGIYARTLALHSTTTTEQDVIGTPFRHMPLNEVYKDKSKRDRDYSLEIDEIRQGRLVDTSGCRIPLAVINYPRHITKSKFTKSCGKRAVFLKKIGENKVSVMIKMLNMKHYLKKNSIYDCCYRFLRRSDRPGYEATKIQYTSCKKLTDKATVTLQTDFINIQCFQYNKQNISHIIYDDVYAFAKKVKTVKTKQTNCTLKYNILMLGMDSMSLPRFAQTMPRTLEYLQNNFWFSFGGYHKVGDNTFPNLMAAFSGKNLSDISKRCSRRMDQCNDLLIWSKFKKDGYVTAYGEDYLRLPDTFSGVYTFRHPPTHHYMRPLFLKGETELYNRSLVCAGKVPSGQQLLNYAVDFANTYRDEQFFGVFWMNSFSHNVNSNPQEADKMIENFFNQLIYTGVTVNTFIIFFSDHGIRFGEHRLKMESYYDERIPFLFMLTPTVFQGRYPLEFKYAAINQFRLITPYDLYNTLIDINRISACSNISKDHSKACPKCQSLFELVSVNRTCQDVAIHDKWCSCHNLYPLDVQDKEGTKSVQVVVSYIKDMIQAMKTKRCWGCMSLTLKNIIRIHFYYDSDKTTLYYVVAFTMTPGNVSYEATVVHKHDTFEVVGPVSVISPYRGLGKCTNRSSDRLFCFCQKIDNCNDT